MLRPNYETQKEVLTGAIIELLWKVSCIIKFISGHLLLILKCGSQKQAVLVIPGDHPNFEASKSYSTDGVTEKV